MNDDLIRVVRDELHRAGVRDDITVAATARHRQVRWRSPTGLDRIVTCSATASDQRAVQNTRAETRKLLRLDGLLPTSEPREPARQPSRIELLEQRMQRLEARIASLTACSAG